VQSIRLILGSSAGVHGHLRKFVVLHQTVHLLIIILTSIINHFGVTDNLNNLLTFFHR